MRLTNKIKDELVIKLITAKVLAIADKLYEKHKQLAVQYWRDYNSHLAELVLTELTEVLQRSTHTRMSLWFEMREDSPVGCDRLTRRLMDALIDILDYSGHKFRSCLGTDYNNNLVLIFLSEHARIELRTLRHSDEFCAAHRQLHQDILALARDVNTLKHDVSQALAGIRTDNQLIDLWPEAAKHLPKDDKPTNGELVPIDLIKQINQRLGVKP